MLTVFCVVCSAELEVVGGMVNLARCACGSRCFRWDDYADFYFAPDRRRIAIAA